MKNGGLLRPFFRWLSYRHLRRVTEKVDMLGLRLGPLQCGFTLHLRQMVPGLEKMVEGGFGARRTLDTIRNVLESNGPIAFSKIWDTLDELESFVSYANTLLDSYDSGRKAEDRLFPVREDIRGLF